MNKISLTELQNLFSPAISIRKYLSQIKRKNKKTNETLFNTADLSIDSRKVKEGEIFVAIKGEKQDGHQYILQVLEKKVGLILVNKLSFEKAFLANFQEELSASSTLVKIIEESMSQIIFVEDTTLALGTIASYVLHRMRFREKENLESKANSFPSPFVIAITGTNGKTSTRSIYEGAFERLFPGKVGATFGNFNNNIGLPLSILALPEDVEIIILEMGMNHSGEIAYLSKLVRPDVALITNIASGHIGNFKSAGDIARAKLEIIEGLRADGILLLNSENEFHSFLKEQAKLKIKNIISYSTSFLENLKIQYSGAEFTFLKKKFHVNLNQRNLLLSFSSLLRLLHHLEDNVGNLHFLKKLSLEVKDIVFNLPAGRFEIKKHKRKNLYIIDDTYNANKASVLSSLESMKNLFPSHAKYLILGEMAELGEKSYTEHKEVGISAYRSGLNNLEVIAKNEANAVMDGWISAGGNKEFVIRFTKKKDWKNFYATKKMVYKEPACILVKGSRSSGMEEIVEELLK